MGRRRSSIIMSSSRTGSYSQTSFLAVSFLIALVGVFPFGLLYVFPILAAVTLRLAEPWARIAVGGAAIVLGAMDLLHGLTHTNPS